MASSSKNSSQQKSGEYMKAIVYGNTALKLKREKYVMGGNNHTHQWCFYVKPYHKQDLGVYVKKVEIKLDDSFDNPTRVFHNPPYEVKETGWGEFDLKVKIFFRCSKAEPVSLIHRINLFPSDFNKRLADNTVVIESCDEILFPSDFNKR